MTLAYAKVPTLIISGPIGVGKTTVAGEISNRLVTENVPHCWLDLDALTQTYPRPQDDPFNTRLLNRNLAAVWQNAQAAGAVNLLCAWVVETTEDVSMIADVIGEADPVICRLRASAGTLVRRIRKREIGTGVDWHERRALSLARSLDAHGPGDLVLDAELPVAILAEQAMASVQWRRGDRAP